MKEKDTMPSDYAYRRRRRGSNIAELGPALMIIFLVLLLPAIDLASIGMAYISGYALHTTQLREAAFVDYSEVTPLVERIAKSWKGGGLGKFVNLVAVETSRPSYSGDRDNKEISLSTSMTFRPFLTIPFPVNVPGLNAPMTFNYSGSRTLEDPTHAPDEQ